MESLDVFSVRDLRQRSGELLRDAEEGRIALITKHGRPAILAIPFDERLLRHGVAQALALHLFTAGHATMTRASKLAGMALEEFLELLADAGIDAVDYAPEELRAEIEAAR